MVALLAPRDNNLTTGKVYESVIKKEGLFLNTGFWFEDVSSFVYTFY